MAVAWTDITNAQVAAGAALTTALVTALRDNPEGIAQRATGAPKIFGVAYDYQEFTANGTWTKPSTAEAGDKIIVQVVAGGGAGYRTASGNASCSGGGAGGVMHYFDEADLAATEQVTIGAGGAGAAGTGSAGGTSSFGTNQTRAYLECEGGQAGTNSSFSGRGGSVKTYDTARSYSDVGDLTNNPKPNFAGGGGVYVTGSSAGGLDSVFGGGGGGNAASTNEGGGLSFYAGMGGKCWATGSDSTDFNGEFPGGGGGAVKTSATGDTVGGSGADGVVRVWCIKES